MNKLRGLKMDYEKLKQISRIFDRMLTLPPERRTTYIHTLCGDDPALRQKIEELLALHDQSEELFESHLQKNKELLNDLNSRLSETISLEEDFFYRRNPRPMDSDGVVRPLRSSRDLFA